MREPVKKSGWRSALTTWVNGEHTPKERTLFAMEQRPSRTDHFAGEERRRQWEERRRRHFRLWYPLAAGLICALLTGILLATVLSIPHFGSDNDPVNNEVARRYLEHGLEETGAENAVTAMLISYRGFDTLGESCVLFLAVTAVLMLFLRDSDNGIGRSVHLTERHVLLRRAAGILMVILFLLAGYIFLNGEKSPGGGFSGGTLLGTALILYTLVFSTDTMQRFLNVRVYRSVRTLCLLVYAALYGFYIFTGANGLSISAAAMMLTMDFAVGLVVACTVYGLFALFSQ